MEIEINGEPILREAIREEMKRLRAQEGGDMETLTVDERIQLRDSAAESLIDRILLFQEAGRIGLLPNQHDLREACARLAPRMDGIAGCRAGVDLEQLERDVERQLVIERLTGYWARDIKTPRHSEIRDYYRKHQDQFRTAEMVWASHVVRYIEGRSAEEERLAIERIRERLLREPFAEVAGRYSDCPENGGDLGYFPRGVMVEEFDAVVFSAPLNELTPVFPTPFGFHVALVKDRKREGIRTLNEVVPQISQILQGQRLDDEIGVRLNSLRKNATIQGLAK